MKPALFLVSLILVTTSAIAQPVTNLNPVGEIYLRGLRYNDHSSNSTLLTANLVNGGVLAINCRSLNFTQLNNSRYRFSVVLQDVNRRDGAGVTVFQLRSVRVAGNMIYADVPFDVSYNYLRNRSFYVTVSIFGPQPWHYLSAGTVTLR